MTASHAETGAETTECLPRCDADQVCYKGNCSPMCNPPCKAGEVCKNGDCISTPSSEDATVNRSAASSAGEKFHRHTGLYLSFNAGLSAGTIGTTFDEMDLKSWDFSGAGSYVSFDIGYAVAEDIIFFCEIPSLALLPAPFEKIDGEKSDFPISFTLNSALWGFGGTYYVKPFNFLFSGTVGFAYNSLEDNSANDKSTSDYSSTESGKEYFSQTGFGLKARVGKEWWVSRRWALGVVASYQIYSFRSGDIFPFEGTMVTSLWGICFSATFN
jgi:hypothetical protein